MDGHHRISGFLPIADRVRVRGGDEDEWSPCGRGRLRKERNEKVSGRCWIGDGTDSGRCVEDELVGMVEEEMLGAKVDPDPVGRGIEVDRVLPYPGC